MSLLGSRSVRWCDRQRGGLADRSRGGPWRRRDLAEDVLLGRLEFRNVARRLLLAVGELRDEPVDVGAQLSEAQRDRVELLLIGRYRRGSRSDRRRWRRPRLFRRRRYPPALLRVGGRDHVPCRMAVGLPAQGTADPGAEHDQGICAGAQWPPAPWGFAILLALIARVGSPAIAWVGGVQPPASPAGLLFAMPFVPEIGWHRVEHRCHRLPSLSSS